MVILDFLFYYLTYWFNKRKNLLSWSSAKQRSSYAIGLASMAALFALAELLAFTVFRGIDFHLIKFLFLFLGLALMYIYDFIYIKKGRYESINASIRFKSFRKLSEENRSKIAVFIIVLCFLFPFLIFILNVPFGGHTLGY